MKREKITDAVRILHRRYVGDSAERKASVAAERVNAEVALGQAASLMPHLSPKGSNNLVRRPADNAQGELNRSRPNAVKAHDRRPGVGRP